MNEENIIAIRKISSDKAYLAFQELMQNTESTMNDRASKNPCAYSRLSPTDLENAVCSVIKDVALSSPFRADEIKLVSGQRFPDIVAESYYGVEVKSTNKNHWISTGSSIVESTRCELVESIYMLFGKLGGNPPEFKCRPYQDVLYDIAVTHSPRYLIDMELQDGQSIFSKMGTVYDALRQSPQQINLVRKYYQDKANRENKKEMPWWITSTDIDKPSSMNIRMWQSLSLYEKETLLAKCMILFPETMNPKPSGDKYSRAVLWLCSYCQVVSSCFRDDFSAGGRITMIDGKHLNVSLPRVYQTILKCSTKVLRLLANPDDEMMALIAEFNSQLLYNGDLCKNWLNICDEISTNDGVLLSELIRNSSVLE